MKDVVYKFEERGEPLPKGAFRCHQVHGDVVVDVTAGSDLSELASVKADGLFAMVGEPHANERVTAENCRSISHDRTTAESCRSIALAVQTADCLPVLFAGYGSSRDAIAAVHAGWRGLHKGILLRTVELFERAGISADRIDVVIGPALRACCFEARNDVIDAFQGAWGRLWLDHAPWTVKTPGQYLFDAPAVARLQLESAGISSIKTIETCTYCSPGNWASHRRATHAKARGESDSNAALRQWSWISL